jgi:hypothetical protein
MEHRHHSRVPVGVEMLIYRRGMPVATGRIRDASRGGVFVETSYPELRVHQTLELEFRVPGAATPCERQRLAGHVLRCAGEGFALEVDEANRAALRAIGTLLGARTPNPATAHPGGAARVVVTG